MDRDGTALEDRHVYVFPTSFVVDPDGKIHYGLRGAIEWNGSTKMGPLWAELDSCRKMPRRASTYFTQSTAA